MNFQDILKKSVIDNFEPQSLTKVLIVAIAAILMGVIIFFVYRAFNRTVVYDHSFAVSLAVMTVLTSMIIVTITSNIVLSLGMVGALSIVRYRTAVKSAFDLIFMFWAVAVGIMVGAGFYMYALVASGAALLLVFALNTLQPMDRSYVLIINYNKDVQDIVLGQLNRIKYQTKTKTVTKEKVELTLKVAVKKFDMGIVNKLSETIGVDSAILVQYSSDEI